MVTSPSDTGPNIDIPYITEGGGGEAEANSAFNILDMLIQGSVKDKDLTAPPGSPVLGDRYIVGASATGAWSGQDDSLAGYYNSTWIFIPPREGWQVWVDDEDQRYFWTGSAWTPRELYTPVNDSITAGTPQTQAGATELKAGMINVVQTVATIDDGVKLPASPKIGTTAICRNNHASNRVQLYPPSGGLIEPFAVDTAINFPATSNGTFVCYVGGSSSKWIYLKDT